MHRSFSINDNDKQITFLPIEFATFLEQMFGFPDVYVELYDYSGKLHIGYSLTAVNKLHRHSFIYLAAPIKSRLILKRMQRHYSNFNLKLYYGKLSANSLISHNVIPPDKITHIRIINKGNESCT